MRYSHEGHNMISVSIFHMRGYWTDFGCFLVAWGGVRLSPLGTSASDCLILPAPYDR
jgi:hypothetical protein